MLPIPTAGVVSLLPYAFGANHFLNGEMFMRN